MSKLNVKSMKKSTLDHLITFAMVIVAYLIVQILIAAGVLSSLMQGLLVPMCTYSIVAIGLNLCVGYLGELSIGHAGFMCVGAFSSAFATKLLQNVIPNQIILFITVLIIGTAVAAFFGFLIGIPVLRLRGDYLAIVTLAFGEIIKNVINVLYIAKDTDGFHFAISNGNAIKLSDEGEWLINGAKGIAKIPHLSSFTAGVIMILICLFIVYHLVNSRSGRAIMAIRDNRIAAESVGINITKFKLMAFTISACTQPVNRYSNTCKLWLQHVDHDPCICCIRRYGKFPRFYHCGCDPYVIAGGTAWTLRLSYADLFHRTDRNDAL